MIEDLETSGFELRCPLGDAITSGEDRDYGAFTVEAIELDQPGLNPSSDPIDAVIARIEANVARHPEKAERSSVTIDGLQAVVPPKRDDTELRGRAGR